MIFKSSDRLIPVLLFLTGEALIIATFLLVFSESQRDNLFWLNLVVVSILYMANVNNFFDLFSFNKNFESRIAGIGILWFFIILYNILAIFGISIGWILIITFKFQLLYQAFIAFGLLLILFTSQKSDQQSQQVQRKEEEVRSNITKFGVLLHKMEYILKEKGLEWDEEKQILMQIKESTRYLSASTNPLAEETEINLLNEAGRTLALLENANSDRLIVHSGLLTCKNLLARRKEFYFQ